MNNVGITNNKKGADWESHKLRQFLIDHKLNEISNRQTSNSIPDNLIKPSILEHMNDFVQNKIRLGKIVYTASGGLNGGIPIYQARDGILNMQYTIQNQTIKNRKLSNFIVSKLNDIDSFKQWFLLNESFMRQNFVSYFNQIFVDDISKIY